MIISFLFLFAALIGLGITVYNFLQFKPILKWGIITVAWAICAAISAVICSF
jgi:hypothetical protein